PGAEASLSPLALASARRERSRKSKALDFARRQRGGNLLGRKPERADELRECSRPLTFEQPADHLDQSCLRLPILIGAGRRPDRGLGDSVGIDRLELTQPL